MTVSILPVIDGMCDECGSAEMKRRDDDNESTVNQRLSAYHEQTSPLAEWYDSRGIFHRIRWRSETSMKLPRYIASVVKR